MTILITGAAGFIGSHLAYHCIKEGHTVTLVDNDAKRLHEVFSNIPENRLATFWRVIDVAKEPHLLEEYFKYQKPDVCFHLAAYASEGRSNHIRSFIHSNNTVGTANVINACVNHNCKLVFTSSVAVYSGESPFYEFTRPNPIDEYGLSKYMSEQSIKIASKTQGLEYCIVRPRNVYGPGQNMFDPSRNLFGIWMYNALNNKPCLIYGDGEQKRSFTYIDDLIPSLYKAITIRKSSVNLGSGISYTLNFASETFKKVTGYHNFQHVEARHEVMEATCDTAMARDLLGWPISSAETKLYPGVEKMWDWAKTVPMRELDKMPELEVTVNAHSSLK